MMRGKVGKTRYSILFRILVISIVTVLVTVSGLTIVASSVEGCKLTNYIGLTKIEKPDQLTLITPKPSPDTTPPAAITGLTATDAVTGGTVNLAWSANTDSDFAYYNIYQDAASISDVTGMTPVNSSITTQSTTTYQVTGLADGTTYYFAVTAVDNSGNEDKTVNDASATPTAPDTTPPNFAGLESATDAGTGGTIDLSWSVASDPSTPIIYNIYQATTSGGQNFATPSYTTQNLNYQVTGLTDGTTYYFVVRAEDSVGNEDTNTVEMSATPTAPDATLPNVTNTTPADAVTGVVVTTTIIVQFSEEMNKTNTESAFSTNPATTGSFLWNAAGDKMTYIPSADLDYSTSYEVSIINSATDLAGNPLDGNGNGVQDNPASKDTYKFTFTTENAPDTTPPTFGGLDSAVDTGTGGTIDLSWSEATDPEGSTPITYNIYQATTSGEQNFATPSYTTTNLNYQVTGLTDGSAYYFVVRSRDAAGNEDTNTIEKSATPTTSDTTPPTFAGLESATDAGTSGTIDLSWSAALDTSIPITYNIYQATTSGGQNFATPTYTTTNLNYQVIGLTDGTTYYFVVRAEDAAGNEDTNTVEKSVTPTAPDITPPTFGGLDSAVDTGTGGTIDLSWNAASDPSTPITYNIYQATTSDGQNFATPSYTTTNLNYQVTDLTDGTTYYFVVRSEDSVGNEDTNTVEKSAAPTAADTTLPKVISTTPTDTATCIAVTTTIVVQFDEEMNQANTEGAFSTNPATTGTFSWNAAGDKLTYTPSASLVFSTAYEVSITNSATDLAGNKLDGNGNGVVDNPASKDTYTFSFTTEAESDTTGPTVSGVAVNPATVTAGQSSALTANVDDSATGNSNIGEAEWSEGTSAANPGAGTAMSASDGNFNSATEGVTATIDTTGWTAGTYKIWVRGKDTSNNWGNAVSTTLTVNGPDTTLPTVVSTTPLNGATGAAVTTTIVVQFSEEMDKTNTEGAFSTNPSTTDSFSWNGAGDTMTYTPGANLDSSTSYTVTITISATDIAGNQLDGDGDGVAEAANKDNYEFSFTTEGGGTVNKYAVVIGINSYKYFNNLQYCVNDALDWKSLLQGEGYTIHYLTDSQATEANVQSEIQWLVSTATADDYVAITFSGHGCNAGDVGLGGGWQGICCYDAASYTEVGIYRDTEMQSDLAGLASTHVFIYFDSCRSGGMVEVADTGRLVQMGCAANGYTYDGDSTQKNGVWTWHTIYYYDSGYTCMEDNFAVAAPAASDWVSTNYHDTMSPIQSDKYSGSFYF